MRLKTSALIILLIVAIIGVVAAISVRSYLNGRVGTVTIVTDDSSKDATISLRGDHSTLDKNTSGTTIVYKLRTGNYRLTISKKNYKPLSTNLVVRTGDKLQVAGHLELVIDPTIKSVEQIPELAGNGYALGDADYFYGKTWAVLELDLPDTDPAFSVVSYDTDSATWKLVLGPGTDFTDNDLQTLPPDVSDYMSNLVTGGSV